MADFNDDRKKEEEEYGGFEPDENDDESFMLEDENDYPAKLPDKFGDEPSSTVRVTASVESLEDDEFEQEEPIDEPIEEPEEIEEIEEISVEEEPEQEIEQEIEDEIDSENIEDEPNYEESFPEETDSIDEEVDLDDDFKKMLQADIDKSKAKREANEIDEEPLGDSEPAKQIGNDADTVVMISDFEADRPSQVKSEDTVAQPPLEGNIPEGIEGEQVKEKKKKKTPIWLLMLYASVATLILTLGIVGLIWYLMSSEIDDKNIEKHKKEVAANHSPSKPKHEFKSAKVDTMTQEEKNWLDSTDINKKDTSLSIKDDKEFFAGLEDDFDEDPRTKNKPVEKPKNNPAEKPKDKPKTIEPKKVVPNKKKEDIASNDVTKSVAPKEKQKSTTKINESEFSMPQPVGPAPETGLFMVQIYSSPSREDAESWLGQLKARQVPNSMITEQDVKGRTWYRVRYGRFETKEAARTSALELGYSQSWIDRVK